MKPTHFSRYLKFALFLAILCSFSFAYAYDFQSNGIYYNIISTNTVEVTNKDNNYGSYNGEVIIPSTVTRNGTTYFVTSIGDLAFLGCSGLTSVTIPNSVTYIGYGAFEYCSDLTNITVPSSFIYICAHALDGSAWYNNQPDGLVYVGRVAYKYKGSMPSGTSIIIREGTLGIACCAFAGCSGLTSITIPNSVSSIGSEAFEGCSGLTSVTIPKSVTFIDYWVFLDCDNLTDIYCLASTPPTINNETFIRYNATLYVPNAAVNAYRAADNWKNFTNIVGVASSFEVDGIYYNITSTNTVEVTYKDTNYNSYSCEVIIPSTITHNNKTYTVTAIGDSAFYDSNTLSSVSIPESVTSIGEAAFFGCWPNLTCFSITPPSVNNSFNYNYITPIDYIYSVYEEGTLLPVLRVPYDALDNYMNSLWNQYSLICYIGAGETETPSITMSVDCDNEGNGRSVSATISGVGTIYSRHEIRGLNSSWQQPYWVEQDTYYYTPSDLNISCLAVHAFAYEYGKLPSQVVTEVSDYVYSDNYIPDQDLYQIELYDAEIDGICYDFYGSTASVAPGIVLFLMEDGEFPEDRYYIPYRNYQDEPENVIIPNRVNFYGNNYVVNSIENYAFGSTTIDYEYLSEHGVSIPYNLGDGFIGFL